MNELFGLGLVDRPQSNRVRRPRYRGPPVDTEGLRRKTLLGDLLMSAATALVEDANLTDSEDIDENLDRNLSEAFWDEGPET